MSAAHSTPAISVAIPFYKGGKVIRRAIESIFAQQGVDHSDIEVIVTISSYTAEDEIEIGSLSAEFPIKVIWSDKPRGIAGDWTAALEKATGKIRTLLHQDDWYEPRTLVEVKKAFDADKSLAIVVPASIVHSEDGSVEEKPHKVSGWGSSQEAATDLLTFRYCPAPSVVFFKGDALDTLGDLYKTEYQYCPEIDLYVRILEQTGDRILLLDTPLVNRQASPANYGRENVHLKIQDYIEAYLSFPGSRPSLTDERGAIFRGYGVINRRVVDLLERINELEPVEFKRVFQSLSTVLSDSRFHVYLEAGKPIVKHLALLVHRALEARPYLPVLELIRDASASVPCKGLADLEQAVMALDSPCSDEPPMQPDCRHSLWHRLKLMLGMRRRPLDFGSPVLICGFHHSGTRLLASLLDEMGVFQIASSKTHESRYIQLLNMLMLPEWNSPEAIARFDAESAARWLHPDLIRRQLKLSGYRSGAWGHKDPRTGPVVSAWRKAFPEARVVNVVRDPLDVLGTLPPAYARFTPGSNLPQDAPMHWSALWRETLRTTREKVSRRYYRELAFEQLCAHPREVLGQLARWLGVDGPSERSVERIQPGKVGKYREWIMAGQLKQSALDTIASELREERNEFGYS